MDLLHEAPVTHIPVVGRASQNGSCACSMLAVLIIF